MELKKLVASLLLAFSFSFVFSQQQALKWTVYVDNIEKAEVIQGDFVPEIILQPFFNQEVSFKIMINDQESRTVSLLLADENGVFFEEIFYTAFNGNNLLEISPDKLLFYMRSSQSSTKDISVFYKDPLALGPEHLVSLKLGL